MYSCFFLSLRTRLISFVDVSLRAPTPPCGTYISITRVSAVGNPNKRGCPPARQPKDQGEGPTTIGCGLPSRSQWALRTPGGASDSGGWRRKLHRRESSTCPDSEVWEEQTEKERDLEGTSEKPGWTVHCHRSPGGVADPGSGLAGRVECPD